MTEEMLPGLIWSSRLCMMETILKEGDTGWESFSSLQRSQTYYFTSGMWMCTLLLYLNDKHAANKSKSKSYLGRARCHDIK